MPEQVNIPIQICKEKHHFEAYLESLRSNSSFNQDNSIGIEYVSVPGSPYCCILLQSIIIHFLSRRNRTHDGAARKRRN